MEKEKSKSCIEENIGIVVALCILFVILLIPFGCALAAGPSIGGAMLLFLIPQFLLFGGILAWILLMECGKKS